MSEVAIKIDHLTKIYQLYQKPKDRIKEAFSINKNKKYHDDFYALEDVSFEVKEGECYGIIGKNGSGKSTLLKVITGVLSPTHGQMEINGRISALLELGAGFNQEYNGIENIYLNGDIMGYSKEEMEERIPEILEFADIGDHIYQPVKTYSSGMFVRLAFAIAINVDPEILIVDEALSVGDAFFQLKCYKKFTDFKKRGKTIVFVTHDLSSVIKYCDRVMVLNEGKMIEEGGSREMVDLYKKILVNQEKVANDKKNKDKEISKNKTDTIDTEFKSNVRLNENIIEYGTREAEIIELEIKDTNGNPCQMIELFQEIEISFKVKFNTEVRDPIFAFTIKNIKGTEICGTNNMYEKMDGFIAKTGDIYSVAFKQPVALQRGSYFLSLGCTGLDSKGNFKVFHRYYDIVELDVSSPKDIVGFFDMGTQVSIDQLN
ncbi:MAG: ABC transporter ATP-binding protein [Bacilli bacterium]